MGSVYKRSYKDKRTGKAKKVKCYSIKYLDASGEWVTEPTDTASRTVALRLLAEREVAITGRTSVPETPDVDETEDRPLSEIQDLYLAWLVLRRKPSTCRLYSERLGFTLRHLAVERLDGLDTTRIDEYVRGRLVAGSSPRTVNLQVSILRRMLAWAQSEGLIARNPLEKWQPVRDPGTNRRRALTPEELPRLLDAAPPWRRILWAVMAATGMRKGEATHILISDFDPAAGVIRLRPEITKASRGRTCPLPSGLTRLLTEYMIEQQIKRPRLQRDYLARIRSDLSMLERSGEGDGRKADALRRLEALARESLGHKRLFANAKGLPIRRNLDREFRLDLARAGIDRTGVCIHSLRYTANSAMLAAGVNETIIRARMGHVSARMTERYHDRSYDDRSGTKAMADLIGVADSTEVKVLPLAGSVSRPRLDLATEEALRPPPEVLAALAEKYSNVLIGRVLRVSEMTVRKLLRRAGIVRTRKIQSHLEDWEVAMLRADLRSALNRLEMRERGEVALQHHGAGIDDAVPGSAVSA